MERELELEIIRLRSREKKPRRNALGPDDVVSARGDEMDDADKENSEAPLRSTTKNRLERLGLLYGGEEVSSPIHRSEEVWERRVTAEQDESDSVNDKYSEERAKRLRALASTINSWEDDMRHISPKKEEPEKYDRFGNKVGSKAVKHDVVRPVAKGPNSVAPSSPPKKVGWDRKILTSLEQQGFKRCESEEHLVYDYVSPDRRDCTSPKKALTKSKPENQPVRTCASPPRKMLKEAAKEMPSPKNVRAETYFPGPSSPRKVLQEIPLVKVYDDAAARGVVPERKPVAYREPSPVRQLSPLRRAGSPQKSAVLEMAAQFEAPSNHNVNDKPRKDPALLSVAEKRAVFEKNAGFIPIVHAPFAQALPSSAVNPSHNFEQREKSPIRKPCKELISAPTSGGSPVRHNVNQAVIDRFKEIEALRHRWDRNKATAEGNRNEVPRTPPNSSQPKEPEYVDTPRSIPVPPPMPHALLSPQTPYSDSSPQGFLPKPAFTPSPPIGGGKIRMGTRSPAGSDSPPRRQLPRVLSIKEKSPKRDFPYPDVKRIKVSPPKKGHIYPSISDIETESEVPESDLEAIQEEGSDLDESSRGSTSCFSSDIDSSFGQQIVRQASKTNLKRPVERFNRTSSSTSSMSASESRILREMDDLLDEAMSGMPSPPKKSRSSPDTCSTASFEYSSSDGAVQPSRPPQPAESNTPLIHSVSVYRKQQNQTTTPTVRREVRTSEDYRRPRESAVYRESASEEELVQARIKELQTEIGKQLETISQASKALNLCHSTPGFGGSPAELEAQKLLLVANARWTALGQEVERLRIEKKLKPGLPGRLERGDISVSRISLPVKSFQSGGSAGGSSAVVLLKSGPTVLHTECLTLDKRTIRDGRLCFEKGLSLKGLYSDFTASIEVYGYLPKKDDQPFPDSKSRTPNKKDKRTTTPKKHKDKGFLPVESPAGPNAVRSTAFQLWGYAVFSLREVNRKSFTLNKVPYTCPLEGSLEIAMASSMQTQVEHSGFLTKFEDVSGFGAWKRRWAVLRGSAVAFWAYPDHCTEGKVPLDTIDLTQVTSREAELAPNERCARPHTILLESRDPDGSIPESLVAVRDGTSTLITHLLSADTKEERLQWCAQLNKVLHLLRAWKVTRNP